MQSLQLGAFPEENYSLSQMRKRAQELYKCDFREAKLLEEKMFDHMQRDPRMQRHSEFAPPILMGLDAHLVQLGKGKKYLLCGCPATVEKAARLYEAALEQGVFLFVSLLRSDETEGVCNNFWKNKALEQLGLHTDWAIQNVKSKVLATAGTLPTGEEGPQIIESELSATKGSLSRKIIHLHFDGWNGGQLPPSLDLLNSLFNRIEEVQKLDASDAPIQINCYHGRDRTGLVAVLHALRRDIHDQRAAGIKFEDINLNVLQTTYAFKLQRDPDLLRRANQLAGVFAILANFYARLQETPSTQLPLQTFARSQSKICRIQ